MTIVQPEPNVPAGERSRLAAEAEGGPGPDPGALPAVAETALPEPADADPVDSDPADSDAVSRMPVYAGRVASR